MEEKVILNDYGFYELENKPSEAELEDYYKKKYFQDDKGNYSKEYSPIEIEFLKNRAYQKINVIDRINKNQETGNKKFLDIGCGEGWSLNCFDENGYDVFGIDQSIHGVENHNKKFLDKVIIGDIYSKIEHFIEKKQKFDVILLDNVLEHLLNPEKMLDQLKLISKENTILIIEVPNDFSTVQSYLLENKLIKNRFWIVSPDHISYFNNKGLLNLCKKNGWENEFLMSDFPIDMYLFNEDSNYNLKSDKGKNCHFARINFERMLNSHSMDKCIDLYSAFADAGLGRNIIGFFEIDSK